MCFGLQYLKAHPEKLAEKRDMEEAHGIHQIHVHEYTGICVDIICAAQLNSEYMCVCFVLSRVNSETFVHLQ